MTDERQRLIFEYDQMGEDRLLRALSHMGDLTERIGDLAEVMGKGLKRAPQQAKPPVDALTKSLQKAKEAADLKEQLSQNKEYLASVKRRVAAEAQINAQLKPQKKAVDAITRALNEAKKAADLRDQLSQNEEYLKALKRRADADKRIKDSLKQTSQATKQLRDNTKGAKEEISDLEQAIREMEREADLKRALAGSRRYRKALKDSEDQQRKLEFAGQAMTEKLARGFGAVTAGIAAGTAGLIAFFNVIKAGAPQADLFRALGIDRLQSSGVQGILGGRLNSGQSGRLALRGTFSSGLSAQSNAGAARLGRIAASQQSMLTGGDVRELTDQMVRSIQDELASGQIGAGLTAAGVSATKFNAELAKLSAATGQQVETIPVAVREQLLLSQAYQDASANARIFRTDLQDSVAGAEVQLENFGANLAASFAAQSLSGGFGTKGVGRLRSELGFARDFAANATNEQDAALGQNLIQNSTAQLGEAIATDSAATQKTLTVEFDKQAQIMAFQRQDAAGFLEKRIAAIKAVRDYREELTANLDVQSAEAAHMAEIVARQTGISEQEAMIFVTRLQNADLTQLDSELNARLLPFKKQQLQAELAKIEQQKKYTAGLDKETRLGLVREEAEKRVRLNLMDRVGTLKQLNALVESDVVQNRISLETRKATLEEELKLSETMTVQERSLKEREKKAIDLQIAISGQTGSLEEQRDVIASIITTQTFGPLFDVTDHIAVKLGASADFADRIRSGLTSGLKALDRVAGGSLITTRLLSAATSGSTESGGQESRRGGSSNRSGRERLIFEASLIDLNDAQQERLRIEREYAENLKLAGKDRVAREAALRIRIDKSIEVREKEVKMFEQAQAKLASGLAGLGQGLLTSISNASRGFQTKEEERREAFLQGSSQDRRRVRGLERGLKDSRGDSESSSRVSAELFKAQEEALKRERDFKLANEKNTANQRLEIELDYLERREQLQFAYADRQQEIRELDLQREEEARQRGLEMAYASMEEADAFQMEFIERQRAAFEESLPDGAQIKNFRAYSATFRDLTRGVDTAVAALKQYDAVRKMDLKSREGVINATTSTIGAIKKEGVAFIKNGKAQAAFMAGMSAAQAAFAFAKPDFVQGGLYLAAAAKFALLAGSGGGGGAARGGARERRQATALERGSSTGARSDVPQRITQIFLEPIFGRVTATLGDEVEVNPTLIGPGARPGRRPGVRF